MNFYMTAPLCIAFQVWREKIRQLFFLGWKNTWNFKLLLFFLLKAKTASAGSNVFYAQFANWFSWGAVRAKSCLSNKYGRQSITTNHSLYFLFSLINKCTNWFIKVLSNWQIFAIIDSLIQCLLTSDPIVNKSAIFWQDRFSSFSFYT